MWLLKPFPFPAGCPVLIQVFPELSGAVPTELLSQTWCLHPVRASQMLKVDQPLPSSQGGLHVEKYAFLWPIVVALAHASCKGLSERKQPPKEPSRPQFTASPSQPWPGHPMRPFLLHPGSLSPSLAQSSYGSVRCRADFYQCQVQTVTSYSVFSLVAALLFAPDLEMP